MHSNSVEDYLKQMLTQSAKADGWLGLKELAENMSVAPSSVTSMMKLLSSRGLVEYVARTGCRLTLRGEQEALRILRSHRLIETFLVEVLGMNWAEVHEEAEALEHSISSKVLERVAELLKHPNRDPHGNPIPQINESGTYSLESNPYVALSEVPEGYKGRLWMISDESETFLSSMNEEGLAVGTELEVLSRSEGLGIIEIQVGRGTELKQKKISLQQAGKIFLDS
jgi:DtxR family Mn-dependent transcriptional regulator